MRKDLEDLNKVVKVLRKNNIHFWMYGGALAGYVKINNLFPWDGDIDLFIWQKDYKKLISLRKKFEMRYIIKGITLALRSETGKNVDIMPFKRDEKKGIAYFERMKTKGKLSRMIYFGIVSKLLDREMYRTANFFWELVEVAGGEKIRQEVPLKFFDNLKEIDLFGVKLLVPEDHEAFMDYTYGDYWRLPVEQQDKHFNRERKCHPDYYINKTKQDRERANEICFWGGLGIAFLSLPIGLAFGVKIGCGIFAFGMTYVLWGQLSDWWHKR